MDKELEKKMPKHASRFTPILRLLFFYGMVYILDMVLVLRQGYTGLAPWRTLWINGGLFYLGLVIVSYLIAPLVGRIFRPKGDSGLFDYSAVWWLYLTVMIVLVVNEEFVSGKFGLSNPTSIIFSLAIFTGSYLLLRREGKRAMTVDEPRLLTWDFGCRYSMFCFYIALFLLLISPHIHGGDVTGLDEKKERAPVILITLDTLRADHIGAYGYEKETTPNLDAFAAESILFENAFTPIPLTSPAHASIMTGNQPQSHQILLNTSVFSGEVIAKPDGAVFPNASIGTVLREIGYDSFAAVSAIHLNNQFGWGHMVDSLNEYDPPFENKYFRSIYQLAPMRFIAAILKKPKNPVRMSDSIVDSFLEWESGREKNDRFFAWLHMFDVHSPYLPRSEYLEKFNADYDGELTGGAEDIVRFNETHEQMAVGGFDSARYLEYLNACYDAELLFMDEQLGRLFDELKVRGIYDDALIIICSDHGEGFGERGFIGHNAVMFDYEMQVPLIIKPPKNDGAGIRIEEPVTLCDIAPTIYDALGIETNLNMDGGSLLPLIEQTHDPLVYDWPVPGMIFLVGHSYRWDDRQVVRSINPATESVEWGYYNLVIDPRAFLNMYELEGILPEDDKLSLLDWIKSTSADFPYLSQQAHEKRSLDAETIEQLKANGYLQ